jgi:membrane-bound lytic murein transglycosylase A
VLRIVSRFILTAMLATLGAGVVLAEQHKLTIADAQLQTVPWADLAGWTADDHAAAFDAFLISCKAVAKRRLGRASRLMDKPLRAICREALALGPGTSAEAREFFETRFRAVQVTPKDSPAGFLTGYYEPVVEGSRVPTGQFTVPMYRRPDDLVAARARRKGAAFPNKGGAFRKDGRKRVPYYDRGQIEDGALQGKGLEICWVRNPVDAFFIQIQGSARVRLEDGATMRLNYAAHNGHPYTPVGGELVQRGIVPREEMSMDRIRSWMESNPDQGKELRRLNRSYIFFRIAELADHQEAVGAQGVALTAGRSIAVDKHRHTYGTPFWIDAELPLSAEGSREPFRRLMIAQDTGSAGPATMSAGSPAGSSIRAASPCWYRPRSRRRFRRRLPTSRPRCRGRSPDR